MDFKKFGQLFSLLFFILCVTGFVFQVQELSASYFRYQTTSKIEIIVRETDEFPSILFCPRYLDIIDRSNHKQIGLSPKAPVEYDDHIREISLLTIKQVMELTPDPSTVMSSCMYRDCKTSNPIRADVKKCYEFFNVTKSVTGEDVCYSFRPRSPSEYFVGEVTSSLTYSSVVAEIVLSHSVAKAYTGKFIRPSELDIQTDPLYSRKYSSRFGGDNSINDTSFHVFGKPTEINRLPYPYDTKCTLDHDRQTCFEECLIQGFKRINRIPWSGFHHNPLDMKLFTHLDYDNKTMANVANESIEGCRQECKLKTECHTLFSITSIQQHKSGILSILLMVPSAPHIRVTSVPLLTFVGYMVQVGSCFGVWFGLSMMSLNPIKWKVFRRFRRGKPVHVRLSVKPGGRGKLAQREYLRSK